MHPPELHDDAVDVDQPRGALAHSEDLPDAALNERDSPPISLEVGVERVTGELGELGAPCDAVDEHQRDVDQVGVRAHDDESLDEQGFDPVRGTGLRFPAPPDAPEQARLRCGLRSTTGTRVGS